MCSRCTDTLPLRLYVGLNVALGCAQSGVTSQHLSPGIVAFQMEQHQDQHPDMNCDALNAKRARLLAERDDLNKPQLSMTDAEREAELTRMNGKFYTIAKPQSDKSYPLVAYAKRPI